MLIDYNDRKHLFGVVVGTILMLLLPVGGAGAATNISECGTISEPGEYVLNTSVTNTGSSACINIDSSDVIFDGAGYTIDGLNLVYDGIYVTNLSMTLTNVTVQNVIVINSSNGIHLENSNNNYLNNNTANSNSNYGIWLENSNNNTVKNNTLDQNDYGIYAQPYSDVGDIGDMYLGNTIINTANSGIYLDDNNGDISNITIEDNTITSSSSYYDGIYLYASSYSIYNITIKNNTIRDALDDEYGGGIVLYNEGTSIYDIKVLGNTISNSYYGIYLESSDSNNLTNNTISDSTGSTIYGIYLASSSSNNITNNTLTNNTASSELSYYGIYLDSSNDNTLSNNTITNNTDTAGSSYGISLSSSNSNTLANNTITNITGSSTSYGLYLTSSSSNTIYNNYFNNTNNASDDGTNTWNTTQTSGMNIVSGTVLGGNFWASPDGNGFSQTCADADGDGICDTTYSIDGGSNIDYLPLAVSIPSTPSFVTANPIRALTRSVAATRVPTNIYFYYNGSIIGVNVSLNQSGLTVSGDFANVDNASSISTSTSYQNGSAEEYIYTLTATAGNVGVGIQSVTITATNTSTGASNASTFIALMNINPLVFEPTLGGTNWTEIEDFTNATLTFEKFEDATYAVSEGKLEFLDPMNLANSTTGAALQNLGDNLQIAQDSMNLNSAADALAAMNVSSRLTMYNLTEFTNSPGILQDGTPIVMAGQESGGAVSSLTWYPSNFTLVFQVSHWTNYSADGQPPAISFVSPPPEDGLETNSSFVNVSVTLSENGTATLNWNGVNESMTGVGTGFYNNKTSLLSGNYTFRVYANDPVGNTNLTQTRTVRVNRSTTTNISGSINTTNATVTSQILITAPDTNVTVDIPVGTVARNASGGALTNLTTDSLADVGSSAQSAATSARLSFLGKNLSLGPDGATFVPDIQIRFNYTDDDIPAGILESNLKVKWYNISSGVWETLTTYEHNQQANYIIANSSHFSTFALLGTISTTTTTAAGSGGAGTGGSGVTTSEPLDNILKAERYDKNLLANTPVTYTFFAPEHGIYEITIIGKENENDIAVRVEALKGTSKLVNISAPGTVYKNINIWAGTKRIKESVIRFKVENSWLTGSSLASSDVKMVKWDGSIWVQIETAETTKDTTFTYYETKTGSFSQFAITGLKGGAVVPTATSSSGVTETPKPAETATSAPTKKVSGFELVLVVAALCSVYLSGRKRR